MESYVADENVELFETERDLGSFNHIFYWNALDNPFDTSEERDWKLYSTLDQIKLNEDYEIYLQDKQKKFSDLGNYKVDFGKFLQINKNDESRIRPVKIISQDINKEIEKFTEEYNTYLALIYPKLADIFDGQIDSHYNMKSTFRSKIAKAGEDKKIELNVAYDYLSDPERRKIYDPKDIKKLKKVEFNYNLLILKSENELLKKLLKEQSKTDFDVNFKGISGMSLLYMASRCGYRNIVAMLLDSGSNPSEQQAYGSTALHVAAFYGHMKIVQLLLEVGVDADIKNDYGSLAEEEAHSDEIKNYIHHFKNNDKSYKFFKENNQDFKNVKLVFNGNGYIGKRALLKGKNTRYIWEWDLAWHGTRLEFIPSIIKHGLKKPGQVVDGKKIELREDKVRISRKLEVRGEKDWACAVFTSGSIFYSASGAYAENFQDQEGKTWILILECRLKKKSYKQSTHTFVKYDLRKNENELVENRSEDPQSVEVYAVWQFKKEFLNTQEDYDALKKFLKKYITA